MPEGGSAARAWLLVGVWLALQVTATSIPGELVPDTGFSVDELAHFGMYGVLGVLVARAGSRAGWSAGAILLAWPALAAFGVLDEWHQRFIPGRDPALVDGILDALGAAAGLAAGGYFLRTRWAAWLS